jgi:hypothetical protein
MGGNVMLGKTLKLITLLLVLTAFAAAQTIPAGTKIVVRSSSELSSGSAKAGQKWMGTLAKDLVVGGKTVAKAGSPVSGTVTSAKPSGRLHAPGRISVRLTSVEINGKATAVSTSSYAVVAKDQTKSSAVKAGGGAVAGTVIGAIAGGGKGAAIGALAGGAAGTGVAAATGKREAVIPAESTITFTTAAAAVKK